MKLLAHLRLLAPGWLTRRNRTTGPRILPLDPREAEQLAQARRGRAQRLASRTRPELQP